jgi:hypothetical protein
MPRPRPRKTITFIGDSASTHRIKARGSLASLFRENALGQRATGALARTKRAGSRRTPPNFQSYCAAGTTLKRRGYKLGSRSLGVSFKQKQMR